MRIADRLAFHGAQAEPLRGVVGRLLQAAVVERQRLGLAVFEEQLAVVGAFQAALEQASRRRLWSRPARAIRLSVDMDLTALFEGPHVI